MAKAEYYTVLNSFVTEIDGKTEVYQQGEIVDSGDAAFKSSPHLFVPLIVRGQEQAAPAPAPVEQASAAPGEQRETTGKAITTSGLKGR